MANTQSANVKGQIPGAAFFGREAIPVRAEITVASFATTDIFEMLDIPPNAKVVDWTVDSDDLDTSTNAVFKVGVLNAGKTDLDTGNAVWKTGLTTAQAGGVARMDTLTALRAGSSTTAHRVAIIPTTGAAGGFQAGVIGITVWLVSA